MSVGFLIDKARYRARQLKIRWTVCRREGHGTATRADSKWRHFLACPRCGKFREWLRCDGSEGLCGEIARVRTVGASGYARYLCLDHAAQEGVVQVEG